MTDANVTETCPPLCHSLFPPFFFLFVFVRVVSCVHCTDPKRSFFNKHTGQTKRKQQFSTRHDNNKAFKKQDHTHNTHTHRQTQLTHTPHTHNTQHNTTPPTTQHPQHLANKLKTI